MSDDCCEFDVIQETFHSCRGQAIIAFSFQSAATTDQLPFPERRISEREWTVQLISVYPLWK